MVAPIVLVPIALGSVVCGAKKSYDGYQKSQAADEIVKQYQKKFDEQKSSELKQEQEMNFALERLGRNELKIAKKIEEFKKLADDLLKKLNKNRGGMLKVNIPEYRLKRIDSYTTSAVNYLTYLTGAGAAGVATGFAVYGGVMALGTASTGTAISALSGAAATKATLAAIGGGSIAAGGGGIALGTAILSGVSVAPVFVFAGLAYDRYAEDLLCNARATKEQINSAIQKIQKRKKFFERSERYARSINRTISSLSAELGGYFDHLVSINKVVEEAEKLSDDLKKKKFDEVSEEALQKVDGGMILSSILTYIVTTPIFKVKEAEGKLCCKEDGSPNFITDDDGNNVINAEDVDRVINKDHIDRLKKEKDYRDQYLG